MTDWEQKLEQAKRMLDKGLMTRLQFEELQEKAFKEM